MNSENTGGDTPGEDKEEVNLNILETNFIFDTLIIGKMGNYCFVREKVVEINV